MAHDLQRSLDGNAQQWLALAHSISTAEQVAFDKIHDGFFAAHGGHFMARAYRATFGRVLQNMTDAERDKLLVAFRALLARASSEPHTVQPCWVVAASDDALLCTPTSWPCACPPNSCRSRPASAPA